MSVILVTDDSDDDIQIPKYEHIYQQIKELEYNFSSIESTVSIVNNPKTYHCRRRYRPQQCLVKHLLTYMFTLLFLINHLHWSIIFFSLSSIKFMSTYASTSTTSSPKLSSSIIKEDEQRRLPIQGSDIDRLCSRTSRAQRTPYEKLETFNQVSLDTFHLNFCSNHTLSHSINQTLFFNEMTENECRKMFEKLIYYDEEARNASKLFFTYMEAIDCASEENRYSIIRADCLQAYRTWTCSVRIPYFHQTQRIPPCQTICDEVERVCPTFRPSDREPLFAGQSLFFCDGGIVTNSDYGQPPHCFNTCHLADGSFKTHSVSSTSSNQSSLIATTKTSQNHASELSSCFEIELLTPSLSEQFSLPPLPINDSIPNDTNNTSISSSAISSVGSSIIRNSLTCIFVFLSSLL
ncbi:unnamed protein product [Rotaria magnacalcarata]|uniref:FZ domain-containing protein n=3 Tax=Rotaria magnacalcarata TaxID=392030 RepID=A0A814W8P9_9BILA|nr:unnamed protein product [Rotaria magnacalcarata]CAF3970018.1 unnamed protein product [Rotaria magnacalcarata]